MGPLPSIPPFFQNFSKKDVDTPPPTPILRGDDKGDTMRENLTLWAAECSFSLEDEVYPSRIREMGW